ncbi:hypothetical protein DXM27_01200 [Rhizobium rhizogenes]|uniref:Uncharacterized protein n=1 Tax=Rhizobium rhizogenes TaxID=359 RepID=A0AA88F317_RHIRH|nr:hypothetical protein DXM27_01200 [Rhizobium rhizogenes]
MEQKNSLRRDKTVRFCPFVLLTLPPTPDADDEATGELQADFPTSHGFMDFHTSLPAGFRETVAVSY